MGGTVPGHTTDAVAAVLAEYVRADALVLCKDVAGVFSADPKRDKRARLIPRLTGERLVELVSRAEAVAGVSAVTDLLAAKVIERSSMRAYVVDGREEGAVAAARGGPCRGSVVN
jgi:uridylate kinase